MISHDDMMDIVATEAVEALFVCYECKDGFHDHCIGVPCMCDCPVPPFSRANVIDLEPEYYI